MSRALAAVMKLEANLLLPTYDRFPVLFERGDGVYLYDSSGKKYLDFLSGIGVNALGYAHPVIQKTIWEQSSKLIHISNLFFHKYQAELAGLLTGISGLDRAFFCNSGTEAWEGALKLARAYARTVNTNGHKPRTHLLVMENSFHGRTFGSLATTGQKKYRAPFAPLVPGVVFVRFNDVADLKKKFDRSVCAIGLETVQGEGGVRPVSAEFLKAARALTRRTGALLILDEIQCGLGRTGRYFAFQRFGVKPDIVTIAKPLAAGLPLGAILTTAKVAACFHPGMHGTTFGGGPLACAVAATFVRTLKKERLLAHVSKVGAYFHKCLLQLQSRHPQVRNVRGLGLMLAAELDSTDLAKAVVKQMLERGFVINRTNDNVLRFLPPYVIEKQHVDQMISALDKVLSANAASPAAASRPTRRRKQ
ncbi:MAG: aspartate aminotransferase family protein [Acidobacteriia bacterium]|nr:aspartate aminotransferase family protein [Terriglobia bacterium]